MVYRLLISVVLPAMSVVSVYAEMPQLAETGVLVTEAASRSRLGNNQFYVGDLLYVQVVCPADAGDIYVSAHMEYQKPTGDWAPVPTTNDQVGEAYTSGVDKGLRDYVHLRAVKERTQRNISLFMPYDAAKMPAGLYARRYVIRLWDQGMNDVARTALPAEKVDVRSQAGRTVVKVVECKACCRVSAPTKDKPLEPIPAAAPSGAVHFFSAKTGKWVCPGKTEELPQ
jgi:hypothetical protein